MNSIVDGSWRTSLSHLFENIIECEILLWSAVMGVVGFADFNTISVNSMVGSVNLRVSI